MQNIVFSMFILYSQKIHRKKFQVHKNWEMGHFSDPELVGVWDGWDGSGEASWLESSSTKADRDICL